MEMFSTASAICQWFYMPLVCNPPRVQSLSHSQNKSDVEIAMKVNSLIQYSESGMRLWCPISPMVTRRVSQLMLCYLCSNHTMLWTETWTFFLPEASQPSLFFAHRGLIALLSLNDDSFPLLVVEAIACYHLIEKILAFLLFLLWLSSHRPLVEDQKKRSLSPREEARHGVEQHQPTIYCQINCHVMSMIWLIHELIKGVLTRIELYCYPAGIPFYSDEGSFRWGRTDCRFTFCTWKRLVGLTVIRSPCYPCPPHLWCLCSDKGDCFDFPAPWRWLRTRLFLSDPKKQYHTQRCHANQSPGYGSYWAISCAFHWQALNTVCMTWRLLSVCRTVEPW